jgi:hypothetical protein
MTLLRPAALVALLVAVTAAIPSAQIASSRLKILAIEGAVFVDDQPVAVSGSPVPLRDPSVVRTALGRATIALAGGALFLDQNSTARVVGNAPYNFNRVEVISGSAVLRTVEAGGQVMCEDMISLSKTGLFRIDVIAAPAVIDTKCRFRVFEGAAAVQLASVTSVLTSGQTMSLNKHCGDMLPMKEFDVRDLDDFDRWARK